MLSLILSGQIERGTTPDLKTVKLIFIKFATYILNVRVVVQVFLSKTLWKSYQAIMAVVKNLATMSIVIQNNGCMVEGSHSDILKDALVASASKENPSMLQTITMMPTIVL